MIPQVSVVIPTFNRAGMLPAAIQSALRQHGVRVEVLVCDDGSTDSSRAGVMALGDDRVRWLDGCHSGSPAAPRNRGIAASRAQWVAFLDSDDVWLESKLKRQLALVRETGAMSCTVNALRCGPTGLAGGDRLLARVPPLISVEAMLRGNLVVTSGMLASKEALEEAGGFPESRPRRTAEDYALWLRLARLGAIAGIDDPLVIYRDEPEVSVRSTMTSQASCVVGAFGDFFLWGLRRRPRILPSPRELGLMARQLGVLCLRQ